MLFGRAVTTKWLFVMANENYIRVFYTGLRTANKLNLHYEFMSSTIIVSDVLINKTLG